MKTIFVTQVLITCFLVSCKDKDKTVMQPQEPSIVQEPVHSYEPTIFFSANNLAHHISSVAIDPQGNVYFTGSFEDEAKFDNIVLHAIGKKDLFIAKYDARGKAIWAKQAGIHFEEEGMSLAVNHLGEVYVSGYFQGTTRFDTFKVWGEICIR